MAKTTTTTTTSSKKAATTKEVAWLTGAAKDDDIVLLATDTGALSSTTFNVSDLLGNDPGSASIYGVYSTFTPYADASTKTPLASAWSAATSLGGNVSVNNGVVTYTRPAEITDAQLKALPAGQSITDTFYYVIWMAEKGAYSVASANVQLTGIDDAATITGDDAGDVVEDVTTTFSGALSVIDPDTGESGFAAASMSGTHGTLTITPGTTGTDTTPGSAGWAYSLDHDLANSLAKDEVVTDTFDVASLGGTTFTVTITVTGTNDGPVAAADVASTTEDAAVTIAVLANDSDVDHGATLTVLSATAAKGSASIESNQVVFDPGAAFDHLAQGASEATTVTYTIEDEHGASSTSTVEVTVLGENDGPTASNDVASTGENTPAVIDVLANDTDPDDGAVLSLVSVSGDATIVDGKVVFDPGTAFDHLAAGTHDTLVFTYIMQDEWGAQSSASINLTVNGVNDQATITGDTQGLVQEDGVLTAQGDLTVHDVDDGENVTGSHGSLTGQYGDFTLSNGHWTYTLRNNDAAVQALNTGDSVSDTLQVFSFDGTASVNIEVAIQGLTDANPATKWMVNHGQDTLNERYVWVGFDSNDYIKFASNLTYTAGSFSEVANSTEVVFQYKNDPDMTITIVLVGYTGFTDAQVS